MRILSETEKAYIAGIIDGEGCICLVKAKRGQRKRGPSPYVFYAIHLRVANTRHELIAWLLDRIGGKMYVLQKTRGNRKLALQWHTQGRQAKDLLAQVEPYLVIKRAQAEVARRFFALGRTPIPSQRARLWEEMRTLNWRGLGNAVMKIQARPKMTVPGGFQGANSENQ